MTVLLSPERTPQPPPSSRVAPLPLNPPPFWASWPPRAAAGAGAAAAPHRPAARTVCRPLWSGPGAREAPRMPRRTAQSRRWWGCSGRAPDKKATFCGQKARVRRGEQNAASTCGVYTRSAPSQMCLMPHPEKGISCPRSAGPPLQSVTQRSAINSASMAHPPAPVSSPLCPRSLVYHHTHAS
jgi:hypothetical protein